MYLDTKEGQMTKDTQKVEEIMPGCKVIHTSAGEIMVGCPSEILKVFARQNRQVPQAIVLPTHFFSYGIVQAALEFVLYNFLFIQGRFFKGEKLTVFGTEKQINRMTGLLHLTLNGPSRSTMENWGIPKDQIDLVEKFSDHFRLKDKSGKPLAICELINFRKFKYGHPELRFERINISIKDQNVFKFEDQYTETFVDINIKEAQRPQIPIPVPRELPPRAVLGATALSKCTTGFDHTGYTSGVILWINGMGVSVDGVAWMKEHLRSFGINTTEIKAHIVTHIHDDHSNIFDLIVNGKVFNLISDKLGYHCLVSKAALLLDMPEEEIKKMIQLIEVIPGQPLHWHGATFEFWPVAHPIPTMGFRVTVAGKSIVYSADTIWGSKLNKLFDSGVIPKDVCERIQDVPMLGSELTFHDAGGGMIHPDLKELADLPEQIRRHIVPTHMEQVPDELRDKFDPIEPGQSWELIGQRTWDVSDFMRVSHAPILSSISEEWMHVVISQGRTKEYPANYTLLQEGKFGKSFYLLIGGTVKVLYNNERVATLSTGDFFGEISLMYDIPCTASIVTKSPIKVLELPQDIFMEMVSCTGLMKKLEKIHQIRPVLIQLATIKDLPAPVQNRLVEATNLTQVKAGEVIIKQGDAGDRFYGIVSGKADVFSQADPKSPKRHIATLYRNQCFGEMALIGNGVRTADVVAQTDMELFSLTKEDFVRIIGQTPMFFYAIGILAQSRAR